MDSFDAAPTRPQFSNQPINQLINEWMGTRGNEKTTRHGHGRVKTRPKRQRRTKERGKENTNVGRTGVIQGEFGNELPIPLEIEKEIEEKKTAKNRVKLDETRYKCWISKNSFENGRKSVKFRLFSSICQKFGENESTQIQRCSYSLFVIPNKEKAKKKRIHKQCDPIKK